MDFDKIYLLFYLAYFMVKIIVWSNVVKKDKYYFGYLIFSLLVVVVNYFVLGWLIAVAFFWLDLCVMVADIIGPYLGGGGFSGGSSSRSGGSGGSSSSGGSSFGGGSFGGGGAGGKW